MTSQLSRQGRLPTWNRPGLCRKSGADVRKLARDQSTPISLQSSAKDQATSKELSRVVQLEKNVLFLKQQHQETLEQLHREVEKLRSENRELNLKLVMCCCKGRASRGGQRLPKEGSIVSREVDMESGMANEELQAIFLDEEVRKLRNALSIERTKSNRLMRIIEKKVLDRQKSSSYDQSDESTGPSSHRGTNPLPNIAARPLPHTLEDCNVIIKDLRSKNSQQSHELLQIKADLRDVLYSHKWTPDAFLMARAYVSDDSSSNETLPPIETQATRGTLEKAYQRMKEEITLPALMPKVPSMVAQRQRRGQAVRRRGITKPLF